MRCCWSLEIMAWVKRFSFVPGHGRNILWKSLLLIICYQLKLLLRLQEFGQLVVWVVLTANLVAGHHFEIFHFLWYWGRGPLLNPILLLLLWLTLKWLLMIVVSCCMSMLNIDIQLYVYAKFGISLLSSVYTQNRVWECWNTLYICVASGFIL